MSDDTTTLKLGTAAVETIAGREPAPPTDDALVPTDEPALAPAGLTT